MRATRIIANLRVADIEEAKSFYAGYLGLSTEEFNMGWVARYTSPDSKANIQLVTRDATAPEDSVISVHTDDVEGAYEEAQQLGYEIVKFFPAVPAGGLNMLQAFHGPFPTLKFCPTGGITAESAINFLALPNVVCVGGSWLTPKAALAAQNWDEVTRLAHAASELSRPVR